MAHRTLVLVAAAMLGGTPELAHAGDALADLVMQVEALRVARDFASAAKLAAESAAREDLGSDARVLLGGLARQNFELSYKNNGPITDLCGVVAVMRLVAPLDTPEGGAAKLSVAEDAKTRLEAATGRTWSAVCPDAGGSAATGSPGKAGAETSAQAATVATSREANADNTTTGNTAAAREMSNQAAPRLDATPPLSRPTRRVQAGVGTLVPGVLLAVPFAATLVYRADINHDMAALRAMTKGRPITPDEKTTAFALDRRHQAATIAAAVLGTTAAALVVSGAILLATRGKQRRVAVAPWGARAIAGLVVHGRF